MPLNTEVIREGETVKGIWKYGYFTLSCMYTAAIKDQAPDTAFDSYEDGTEKTFGDLEEGKHVDFSLTPIYYLDIDCDLVRKGSQVLANSYSFRYNDDFTLEFKAGDTLKAWRSSK